MCMHPQEELLFVWLLLIAAVVASFLILRYKLTLVTPSAAALCLGIVAGIGANVAGAPAAKRASRPPPRGRSRRRRRAWASSGWRAGRPH
jgi:hypothetical protein